MSSKQIPHALSREVIRDMITKDAITGDHSALRLKAPGIFGTFVFPIPSMPPYCSMEEVRMARGCLKSIGLLAPTGANVVKYADDVCTDCMASARGDILNALVEQFVLDANSVVSPFVFEYK